MQTAVHRGRVAGIGSWPATHTRAFKQQSLPPVANSRRKLRVQRSQVPCKGSLAITTSTGAKLGSLGSKGKTQTPAAVTGAVVNAQQAVQGAYKVHIAPTYFCLTHTMFPGCQANVPSPVPTLSAGSSSALRLNIAVDCLHPIYKTTEGRTKALLKIQCASHPLRRSCTCLQG